MRFSGGTTRRYGALRKGRGLMCIRGGRPWTTAKTGLRSSLGQRPQGLATDGQEATPGKRAREARHGQNRACEGYADKAARVSGRQTKSERNSVIRS